MGVLREVPRDSAEPRPEVLGPLERCPLSPRRPEGLLGHVFAEGQVATGAIGHGTDQGLVSPDQYLEGRRAALADESPEFRIRLGRAVD